MSHCGRRCFGHGCAKPTLRRGWVLIPRRYGAGSTGACPTRTTGPRSPSWPASTRRTYGLVWVVRSWRGRGLRSWARSIRTGGGSAGGLVEVLRVGGA
jgi:hypothetical protein